MRGAVLLAVLLCAAQVAGCSAEVPAAGGGPAAVPGISAEAVQLRTDAAAGGRIQVRITASAEFRVTSVALQSPGFAEQPPREVSSDFVPGRVTDLRTPLGEARCDSAPEPASARLTVVRDGGAAEKVDVPLEAEVLARIHADECAEEELLRRVGIELTDLRDDADGLTAALTVTRRSGEDEVRLTRLAGSVLVAVATDLPLALAADASTVSTPARFSLVSCEPHVLAESKQPFLFTLGVEVGAEDEVTVDLPVTEEVRSRLQAMVQRVCR